MKDKVAQLTASRKQLLQQMPDLSTVLPGSLLSRMVRCNKPGCRFCEGKGKGHFEDILRTLRHTTWQERIFSDPALDVHTRKIFQPFVEWAKTLT